MAIRPIPSDVGRVVVYQPRGLGPERQEIGVITSLGRRDDMVHVRYGSDHHSKATYTADLRWHSSRRDYRTEET